MKKLYASAFVLFISLSFAVNTISAQDTSNKLIATFKGVTETEYFKFVDDKNVSFLFYDLDENIELSLYEDELIGKKFSITWVNKEIEIIDEDGNPTEEKQTVKTITAITEKK